MKYFQSKNTPYKAILQAVEKRFNRGKSSQWRNKDFEDLSFEIHRASKILISAATLKRLFGKVKTKDNYTPQQGTLEALITYSDFSNRDHSQNNIRYRLIAAIVGILVVAGVVISWLNSKPFSNNMQALSCALQLEKLEGIGQATAFFNYELSYNDSMFLDFGDATAPIFLPHPKGTRTHFYGIPGYHLATLKGKNMKHGASTTVFVPSEGWQVFSYYYAEHPVSRYYPIPFSDCLVNGSFHPSAKILAKAGLDTTKIISTQLCNYAPTGQNADSFRLQARCKNDTFWPGVRCFSIYFTIQGSKGKVMIKLTDEGCSGYGEYVIGEKLATGSTSDLSAFAIKIQEWSVLEIRNTERQIHVLINGTQVFSDEYQNSLGEILGTNILFHGSASIDYLKLETPKGPIFDQDF